MEEESTAKNVKKGTFELWSFANDFKILETNDAGYIM